MTTPFPVPIHRRLHDTVSAVILTNEKPSFPVPNGKERQSRLALHRFPTAPSRASGLRSAWPLPCKPTEHLADVGLDVDVLQVLHGVGVEQPQGGVQPDGHPDAVAFPGQLTDLAVLAGVSVKRLLQRGREKRSAAEKQRKREKHQNLNIPVFVSV